MADERLLVWGAAGHARVLADLLALLGTRIGALFDNDPTAVAAWTDVPVRAGWDAFHEWRVDAGKDFALAAVAIGGARGRERCEIADRLAASGLRLPTLLHPRAVVAASAGVGAGTQVLAAAVVGSAAKLGRHVIVNTGSTVDHECQLADGVHVAPGATLCGCVTVGACSLIGPGCVVVPRIRIGCNVIVGAGSVVTRDLPNNVLAYGSPARVLRNLNSE